MGSGSSKQQPADSSGGAGGQQSIPPVVLRRHDAMQQEDKEAALRRLEEDFYREAYNEGQKQVLEGVNSRADQLSDVKMAEKLSEAEKDRQQIAEQSLEQFRKEIHSLRVKGNPCAQEREACLACYRSHGSTDPLQCETQLQQFEQCTSQAAKKHLSPSGRA
eukprot:gb/GECG01008161.1/.p1 GENE.gb/GECG01008161.1/~~gb/GECG01008161.1/.p1  ORF type:complete len:162 (+),score=33.69 gb/GECG01008161.1/:1-486(+)